MFAIDNPSRRVSVTHMPFVKLDCGMLDSTIWSDREAREIFITALLMAEPKETKEPIAQIAVTSLDLTGFIIPPGWYGFVPAAGSGMVRRAGLNQKEGMPALERLCSPEGESRSPDFEGRRMARIDGGYMILNYDRFRQKDYTSADRSRRYRERHAVSSRPNGVTERVVTQAEAETEAEADTNMLILSEKTPCEAAFVLEKLNEIAGREFRAGNEHLDFIKSRLKDDGVTKEGCVKMIERQFALWRGTKMEEYLRPKTLFNKTNFAAYYDMRGQPIKTNGHDKHASAAEIHKQHDPKRGW